MCGCVQLRPEEEQRPEGAGPLRYTAILIRQRQGGLFADGSEAKYFAVASNEWKWETTKRCTMW